MRNSPVLFAGIVRRKETVVNTIADLSQTSGDHFGEALLIADFVYQLVGADKDSGSAKGS
jgi:hypothetical protein